MTEQTSLVLGKSFPARPLHLLMAFILGLGFVFLVFRGGWSLGFFLAILLTEAVSFAWLLLPWPGTEKPGDADNRKAALPVQIFIALIILDLGLCMFLYDSLATKILNVMALMVLCPVQYLMITRVFKQDWDQPQFWLEAIISLLVRPFSHLGSFVKVIPLLFHRSQQHDRTGNHHPRATGKILLGLLLALPFLLVCGSLLTASDPIFAKLTGQVWQQLSLSELIIQLVIALMLVPFIFSFLYSGRNQDRITDQRGLLPITSDVKTKQFRIDKTILITFLSCINLMYICFAAIQITYLTGAFNAVLPDNLTYAEYARSGFFELAAISMINLLLVVVSVKGSNRQGWSGIVLRIESLLLIAGSLIQWSSAMFRMMLYVKVYGLTLLRFWVIAFLLLILIVFILLLIKEFAAGFPLFKLSIAAALISLLLLNHVSADAWIARYNINLYQASGKIDLCSFQMLSNEAVPAMLDLVDVDDSEVAAVIADQLVWRCQNLELFGNVNWQSINVSQQQAYALLTDRLDLLKQTANAG